jgi:hypothetical protein
MRTKKVEQQTLDPAAARFRDDGDIAEFLHQNNA